MRRGGPRTKRRSCAADELHDTSTISDATWATLTETYDQQQCMDLVFAIGQYHLVSFALNAFGVERDDGLDDTQIPFPPKAATTPDQPRFRCDCSAGDALTAPKGARFGQGVRLVQARRPLNAATSCSAAVPVSRWGIPPWMRAGFQA